MQEVHPIGGGARAISDRRMRHHLHHPNQALKCPRCESLNTKFCYYNNYNLSQPRHFCKNCRRYWTNGGVLRNVPIGGGCRKSTKRSKPKQKSPPLTKPPSPSVKPPSTSVKPPPPNSLSSSENSSSTTTPAADVTNPAADVIGMFQISESENFVGYNHNQNHNQMMFSSEIGGFPGALMSSSGDDQMMYPYDGKMIDQTVRIDDLMMQSRGAEGGLESLDHHWQISMNSASEGAPGFFDLLPSSTTGVDQQNYWSNQTTSSSNNQHQHHHILSQWSDNANSDLSLFLP